MSQKYPTAPTKLAQFCRDHRITASAFAYKMGMSTSRSSLYLLSHFDPRYAVPPHKAAKKIFDLTGGLVTPNDLVPLGHWKVRLDARAANAAAEVYDAQGIMR